MAALCTVIVQILMTDLESVQRRAFKIITGGIRTPTLNVYNEIGLETLKKRRGRSVLLFFFNQQHGCWLSPRIEA